MFDATELATENAELRAEIEAYRQREVAEIREQIVLAKAEALHYRAEAQRNADLGRQIHAESQVQLERLRTRVQSLEALPNARSTPGG